MPYVKNTTYRDIPFSNETPQNEFYIYKSVADICNKHEEDTMRCRTLGILHSHYGCFYLTNLDTPVLKDKDTALCISFAYMKTGPKSTIISYPVQVFGCLQWKGRPILFASLLLAMSVPVALRMRDAIDSIVHSHIAHAPTPTP